MAADWNPAQYRRFADERSRPFFDLLDLVQPMAAGRLADLGCGSGELTAAAAERFEPSSALGIDSSPAMLASAAAHGTDSLSFELGDILNWTAPAEFDIVIANASLQWVPDHVAVLTRWTSALRPGGQIAVQVPANGDMPSHVVAREVAQFEQFAKAFGSAGPPTDPVEQNVLTPEAYAAVLYQLGYVEQHVRLQVYPHVLASSRAVVDWVRGTMLTRFQKVLDEATFAVFVQTYERRLIEVIGDHEPHFFPFKRILMWGRRP